MRHLFKSVSQEVVKEAKSKNKDKAIEMAAAAVEGSLSDEKNTKHTELILKVDEALSGAEIDLISAVFPNAVNTMAAAKKRLAPDFRSRGNQTLASRYSLSSHLCLKALLDAGYHALDIQEKLKLPLRMSRANMTDALASAVKSVIEGDERIAIIWPAAADRASIASRVVSDLVSQITTTVKSDAAKAQRGSVLLDAIPLGEFILADLLRELLVKSALVQRPATHSDSIITLMSPAIAISALPQPAVDVTKLTKVVKPIKKEDLKTK